MRMAERAVALPSCDVERGAKTRSLWQRYPIPDHRASVLSTSVVPVALAERGWSSEAVTVTRRRLPYRRWHAEADGSILDRVEQGFFFSVSGTGAANVRLGQGWISEAKAEVGAARLDVHQGRDDRDQNVPWRQVLSALPTSRPAPVAACSVTLSQLRARARIRHLCPCAHAAPHLGSRRADAALSSHTFAWGCGPCPLNAAAAG
jgi:hypothetical protein